MVVYVILKCTCYPLDGHVVISQDVRANHDGTIDRMTNRDQQKQQQCKEEIL
jgi:hypothetical protein